MSIRSQLKKWLTGLVQTQEYLCLAEMPRPILRVWAEAEGEVRDVTDEHIFVGYKPLLIGLLRTPVEAGRSVVFHFRNDDGVDVATLTSKAVFRQELENESVVLCEGMRGSHTFIHPFHQWINQQRLRFSRPKPGNVTLPGNLYEQVRIAYSLPRTISVVILSDGRHVNVFPTDLHGPAGPHNYVSSLRINGKATQQVERLRKLVIADVAASAYRDVYGWGTNHQMDLQSPDHFAWEAHVSKLLSLPLPAGTIGYRELELMESVDRGIHRIHFYRVLSYVKTTGQPVTHIHQYYAQWRNDHGLLTNLLLR